MIEDSFRGSGFLLDEMSVLKSVYAHKKMTFPLAAIRFA